MQARVRRSPRLWRPRHQTRKALLRDGPEQEGAGPDGVAGGVHSRCTEAGGPSGKTSWPYGPGRMPGTRSVQCRRGPGFSGMEEPAPRSEMT